MATISSEVPLAATPFPKLEYEHQQVLPAWSAQGCGSWSPLMAISDI